ncbi:serine hydrolase [Paenibacillus sp. NEAU-GSW1]|uniref:serine hydrolase domain-containing protein n=1 Tax=Paenibacillus sp. NEAU-GSW1 TaxID=2682486 RepID=UPI0012E2C821|nr:serine hydrolase domain-containing protein [Paenibacillus sp. NEAU-GSW1]MUT65154.1 serine hydrolase [Paenibacillus sp. NEAU-GSW1]
MRTTIPNHEGWTDASPEAVGFDSDSLRRLDDHYADLIEKGTIQAAGYLISRKGKVIAHRSLGMLGPDEGSAELEPASIRKVYSITKAFTALAIHQLIDRGLLMLTQQVSSIIPEFDTDKHRAITVFHLLTHTSGLRGDPGFFMEPYSLPWFEWAVRELNKKGQDIGWIKAILSGPLQDMPDKEWIYCTSGYAVLGEIIAKVTGKPYEQYIAEEILQPLGMSNTFFQVPEPLRDNVCVTNEWEREQIYNPREEDSGAPPKSGNGLYSNLEDLWKLGQMMLDGGSGNGNRIISRRAVELQTTNHLNGVAYNGWGSSYNDYKYGLGWSLEHFDICSKGTFSHEGYGHCGLYVDPAEELVFAFFVPSPKGYTNESVVTPRAIVWSGLL